MSAVQVYKDLTHDVNMVHAFIEVCAMHMPLSSDLKLCCTGTLFVNTD
jgi:hypothetical protein